jgi:hypothetical protein
MIRGKEASITSNAPLRVFEVFEVSELCDEVRVE